MAKKVVSENPLYHDTWVLLEKYRDVVWSLELSVQQVRRKFHNEYGTSVDDFLESLVQAGADLSGTEIEDHARCIQKSTQMIHLVDDAVALLRSKHKDGEKLYWIIHYTYMTPQRAQNSHEIIDKLRPYIRDISYSTYFRYRHHAIDTLSSILWGYTSKESLAVLEHFLPNLVRGT